MVSQFIIYGLVDPRTGEIRYIGKSIRGIKRAWQHRGRDAEGNPYKAAWIRQLAVEGLRYAVRVIEELSDASNINEAECRWIAHGHAHAWRLTNLTDGGDGGPLRLGKKHTPETRALMSAAKKGKPALPAVAAALRTAFAGRKHSAETIAKMRAAHRGKVFSPEHRARMSAAHAGLKASDEARAAMSASRRGRKCPPGTGMKIAAKLKGRAHPWNAEMNRARIWTPEMREKVSFARRHSARPRIRINLLHMEGG